MKIRFSMRLVLVAFLLSSIVVGWLAMNYRRHLVDRQAVEAIRAYSGDWRLQLSEVVDDDAEAASPEWPALLLGLPVRPFELKISSADAPDYFPQFPSHFAPPLPTPDADPQFAGLLAALGALRQVESVRVERLVLHDGAPECLSGHPCLASVVACEVHGSLSRLRLGRLPQLQSLVIDIQHGEPEAFADDDFPSLQFVDVSGSRWAKGSPLAAFARGGALRQLRAIWNEGVLPDNPTYQYIWSGDDFAQLTPATKLELLELDSIDASAGGFEHLARLPSLKQLTLREMKTPSIEALLTHPTLEVLALPDGIGWGTEPPQIERLGPALKRVDLQRNTLTPEFDAAMRRLCTAANVIYQPGWIIERHKQVAPGAP